MTELPPDLSKNFGKLLVVKYYLQGMLTQSNINQGTT